MGILEDLEFLRDNYKTGVKADAEAGALTVDSRYQLAYLCTQVIEHGEEIVRYCSGISLVADARLIFSGIVRKKDPNKSLLNAFEAGLAQVKLAVETGNGLMDRV